MTVGFKDKLLAAAVLGVFFLGLGVLISGLMVFLAWVFA